MYVVTSITYYHNYHSLNSAWRYSLSFIETIVNFMIPSLICLVLGKNVSVSSKIMWYINVNVRKRKILVGKFVKILSGRIVKMLY